MPLTPTVISAQPLEQTILDYLDGRDRGGLELFLSTQRAPDIADVVDRLPESLRDEVFSLLSGRLKSEVLAEVGEETIRSLITNLPPPHKRELISHLPMDDVMRLMVAVPEKC